MFDVMTSRAALVTSTALVAGAFVVLGPLRQEFALPDPARLPNDIGQIVAEDVSTGATTDEIGVDVARPASLVRKVSVPQEDSAMVEAVPVAGVSARTERAQSLSPAPASSFADQEGGSTGQAVGLSALKRSQLAALETLGQNLRAAPETGDPARASELAAVDARIDMLEREIRTEEFANAAPSPLKITAENPVSTFSVDVDTAAYSLVRNSLMAGQLPPRDAVRIEEMVNYFPYSYPAPDGEHPFEPTVSVMPTPWNADTQIVHLAIEGAPVTMRPPLNLVFLVDTSGSMQAANKLALLKQGFALMLGQLQPEDQVAIVAYAGSAGQVLAPTAASGKMQILQALERLEAGGGTAGQAGLQQAYALADQMKTDGEVSRVILATDGDFNVGLSSPDALKRYIADKRESGTYLSVLGFGRGNLDDATLQALAQNGNGQAAYIDTLSEAQKVLVDQLSGAMFPIADDVKIQVEFNPATVAEYRLIGYETRTLRREDFNNDRVDAGDIGAGLSVTALYEITPSGSPARLSEPLRYTNGRSEAGSGAALDELGFLRLRYKKPGEPQSVLIEQPITVTSGQAGTEAQFALAMAGFGALLRDSPWLGDWDWQDAIALAVAGRGEDPFGYRAEAIRLMRLASSLSAQ